MVLKLNAQGYNSDRVPQVTATITQGTEFWRFPSYRL